MKRGILDVYIYFRLFISIKLSNLLTICISKKLHQLMCFSVTLSPNLPEYSPSSRSLFMSVNNTSLSVKSHKIFGYKFGGFFNLWFVWLEENSQNMFPCPPELGENSARHNSCHKKHEKHSRMLPFLLKHCQESNLGFYTGCLNCLHKA